MGERPTARDVEIVCARLIIIMRLPGGSFPELEW